MAGVDWKSEEDVQDYLDNIYTEYRFSCLHEKNAEGCHLLGDYLDAIKRDFKRSAITYSVNCMERRFPNSCYKAGANCIAGKGTEMDEAKALEYFKIGCEGQHKEACFMSGILMMKLNQDLTEENKKEYIQGIENIIKGCSLSYERSCVAASDIYKKGKEGIVEKDLMKAFKFSLKACHLGNRYACSNVSQMYKKGHGVEKNDELYAKYKSVALDIHKQIYSKNKGIDLQQHT